MQNFFVIVLSIIIAIPLWILYHRIFKVTYYQNALRTILFEFVGAFFCGLMISGLLIYLLGSVFAFLFNLVFWIFKIVITLVSVYLIATLIWKYFYSRNHAQTDATSGIAAAFLHTITYLQKTAPISYIIVFIIFLIEFLIVYFALGGK